MCVYKKNVNSKKKKCTSLDTDYETGDFEYIGVVVRMLHYYLPVMSVKSYSQPSSSSLSQYKEAKSLKFSAANIRHGMPTISPTVATPRLCCICYVDAIKAHWHQWLLNGQL